MTFRKARWAAWLLALCAVVCAGAGAVAETYWLPYVGEPREEDGDLLLYVGGEWETVRAPLSRVDAPEGFLGIDFSPEDIVPEEPGADGWALEDIRAIAYFGEEGIGQISALVIQAMWAPERLCFVEVSLRGVAEEFPPLISLMLNGHSRVALDTPLEDGQAYTLLASLDEPAALLLTEYPYGTQPFATCTVTLLESGQTREFPAASGVAEVDGLTFVVTCSSYQRYLDAQAGE